MPSFLYSTEAQLISALRERYAVAGDGAAARIGRWLHGRSDAELGQAFGVSGGQLAQIKAKLLQQKNLVDDLLAETGQ